MMNPLFFFQNNFLATGVYLFFVSKIDKDLKSVMFIFMCFQKWCHRMENLTCFQSCFLLFPICT